MGVAGLIVPEEHGGAGLEMLYLALASESLAYAGAPGPFFGHSLACLALALAGSPVQQKKWLPRLATGEALGRVALGEEGGAWQPDQWELAGGSSVSGTKTHVPHADRADVVVVGTAGPGLVLIEREAPGDVRELTGQAADGGVGPSAPMRCGSGVPRLAC